MEYNDEKVLSISEYEVFAKAYADTLRAKGFKIVDISSGISELTLSRIFEKLCTIKALLFTLGGFLNTSAFYSLNERQLKKFAIIFDFDRQPQTAVKTRDKTKCFLQFLSNELSLIKELFEVAEETTFEKEIKEMASARLTLLSNILAL